MVKFSAIRIDGLTVKPAIGSPILIQKVTLYKREQNFLIYLDYLREFF